MPLKPEVLAAWPPQGWMYFQPQTGWNAPTPLQVTFDQQVKNIIKMRQANPQFKLPTDYLSVAHDLEAYTEKRIGSNPKYTITASSVLAQKKTLVPLSPSRAFRAVVDAASNAAGVDPRALEEWLGSGRSPVEASQAEARAAICATCPANSSSPACEDRHKSAWMDWFTLPVALMFRKYFAIKHSMKLATTKDDILGKCLACRCELELKVHAPIDHIRGNLEPEVVTELQKYPHCWVLKE